MTVAPNGKAIECHHNTSYPGDIWFAIPKIDKDRINQKRKDSSNNSTSFHSNASAISEVIQGTHTLPPYPFYTPLPPPTIIQNQVSQTSSIPPPPPTPQTNSSQYHHTLIMGGRNEQASLRSRNPNV